MQIGRNHFNGKQFGIYSKIEDLAYLIYYREKKKSKSYKTTKFYFFKESSFIANIEKIKYMELAKTEIRRQKLLKIKKRIDKKLK